MTFRRPPDSKTGSLFGAIDPVAKPSPMTAHPSKPAHEVAPHAAESSARPRLRLVTKPGEPEEDVSLEPNGHGQFVLDFTRDKGTTRGGVVVTRGQLEKLLRIAPAALEMGESR